MVVSLMTFIVTVSLLATASMGIPDLIALKDLNLSATLMERLLVKMEELVCKLNLNILKCIMCWKILFINISGKILRMKFSNYLYKVASTWTYEDNF